MSPCDRWRKALTGLLLLAALGGCDWPQEGSFVTAPIRARPPDPPAGAATGSPLAPPPMPPLVAEASPQASLASGPPHGAGSPSTNEAATATGGSAGLAGNSRAETRADPTRPGFGALLLDHVTPAAGVALDARAEPAPDSVVVTLRTAPGSSAIALIAARLSYDYTPAGGGAGSTTAIAVRIARILVPAATAGAPGPAVELSVSLHSFQLAPIVGVGPPGPGPTGLTARVGFVAPDGSAAIGLDGQPFVVSIPVATAGS